MDYEKYNFTDIFKENSDGSLSPKTSIEVGGLIFTPGATFYKGLSAGGIDFHLYKYKPIAIVKNPDGTLKIFGFFNQ